MLFIKLVWRLFTVWFGILFVGLLIAGLVQVCGPIVAQAGQCKKIKVKESNYYSISATLHKFTHIELPERFMGVPLTGNDSLWDADGQGNHIMIKPNSTEPEGKRTTLTVVGSDTNRAYKFVVTRSRDATPCVIITEGRASVFGGNQDIDNWQSPKEREVMALQQAISDVNRELKHAKAVTSKRIEQALIKYRTFIYTRYAWNKGEGFMGENLIQDVFDDGRFTFIRFKDSHRGLLAVTAEVDGKLEMVENNLEPETENIYKVAGIYPKFILKYGKSKVTVERKNNQSNGVY